MANRQTKYLRAQSRKKGIHKVSLYTRTTHAADSKNSKKHVVDVLEHEQTAYAFNPERAKMKNRQRDKKPRSFFGRNDQMATAPTLSY